jgi:DNA-binding response OmpR family regulator
MHVLIVEDDEGAARLTRQATTEAGYTATVAPDGEEALRLLEDASFDIILLDVMLPYRDGFSVCRSLRAKGIQTPVLILTARDALEDITTGLDSGADDYIVKPFRVAELLARMRALLRRGGAVTPTVLRVGDLTLDPATREATREGQRIDLSVTEYRLLEYLMRNAGRVLTRSMLLEHVWEYDFGGNDNVLDVYISYLRRKIDRGRATPLLHTVRGVGYKVAEQPEAEVR